MRPVGSDDAERSTSDRVPHVTAPVSTVISLLALVFAAIAAYAALTTVQLTRRMQREAQRGRVVEALISIKYSARALEEAYSGVVGLRPELFDRLRDGLAELHRAWITSALGTIPGDDDVLEPLGELIEADPRGDPKLSLKAPDFRLTAPDDIREMAEQALAALLSPEFEEKAPWQTRLAEWLFQWSWRIRHPGKYRRTMEPPEPGPELQRVLNLAREKDRERDEERLRARARLREEPSPPAPESDHVERGDDTKSTSG